ncbi:MAG: T9SS type A sorting domain-containing protein, partial [Crocinitomicaceae bacterium]|nr:T9SS type A sorting domain-containing protein [Crocinitomicaceae bacterium]
DYVTSCQDYTWLDGITYTSSNTTATYHMLGAAANGCDSIVMLNLSINIPDVSVLNNDPTLSANGVGGYQWLDCNNNFSPIVGANFQNYSPDQNGSYAVEVNYSGCVDTSQCFDVLTTGISEKINIYSVLAAPNPSSGLFFLIGLSERTANLTVSDAAGNILIRDDHFNLSEPVNTYELAKGIYFVSLTTDTDQFIITVVKH